MHFLQKYYDAGNSEVYNNSTVMGKKQKAMKAAEQVEPEMEVEEQEVVQKEPLEKWLPFNKYVTKVTKQMIRKRKEALEFIHLDKHQINNAVTSLKEFVEKTRNIQDLFQGGNEGFIYLEVDLAEVPWKHSVKPIQIPLPTPIYSEHYNSRFAVFTTNPEQAFITSIQNLQLPLLSQAISYQRSKKHYRNNKQKLKLLNANDLFFCDWTVYNLLRKPLGKLFYQKKKFPYPINCEEVPEHLKEKYENYQDYLNDLMNYTYTMLGNGPVYTLKIGRFDMTNPQLVKNIMQAAYKFLPYVTEEVGVNQVRQISIKGYNSPSLPIYNYIAPQQLETYLAHRQQLLQKDIQEVKV